MRAILERIGAVALSPYEAKEEQQGTRNTPLPVATDERFRIGQAESSAETAAAPAEDAAVAESDGEDVSGLAQQPEEPEEAGENDANGTDKEEE